MQNIELTKIYSFIACGIVLLLSSNPSIASLLDNEIHNPVAPTLSANSYILVDYQSRNVLAEKNSSKKIEPASLTKMMTMLVVNNEIKNNRLQPTDQVSVSKKAWQAPGSRMFLELNNKVSVADLIKGIIIQSGNDASIAIAEHIAGSEAAFADIMNSYAKRLGMENTHFSNVTGLSDPNHYSTAFDMAILSAATIKEHPDIYPLYSQKSFTYNKITQPNRNRLLWRNDDVDGIKTGQTDSAGFCLAASGIKNNMRLIAVVTGAKTDEARTNDANKLLTWGFRFFETIKLHEAKKPVITSKVWAGKQSTLAIGFNKDLYLAVPKGSGNKLRTQTTLVDIIKAPVAKDEELGFYDVYLNNSKIATYEVIALDSVEQGSVFTTALDNTKLYFSKLVLKYKFW